jgi:hypothetical protein
MRVLISARKGHESPDPFTHYVAVQRDGAPGMRGCLVDLTGLQHSIVNPDSFVDPTITEVTWGLVTEPDGRGGFRSIEGGRIVRADSGVQSFFDPALLKPYLDAFEVRWEEIAREQSEYEAGNKP